MMFLYKTIFYNPLLNGLVYIYDKVGDLGIAIILLTVVIRLILYPIFHKSAHYQVKMQALQPELKKIQTKHKEDKVKATEEMMALYKQNELNPFSGFLFLLLQLPVLIALYQIFLRILSPEGLSGLYSFIQSPEVINPQFVGLINLGESSILIVALAALAQYFQAKLALRKPKDLNDSAYKLGKKMMVLGPVLTLLIFSGLPAAVGFYWLTSSVFSIGQQVIINKKLETWNPGKNS